jgi:hypothetical protein
VKPPPLKEGRSTEKCSKAEAHRHLEIKIFRVDGYAAASTMKWDRIQ